MLLILSSLSAVPGVLLFILHGSSGLALRSPSPTAG